MILWILPAMFGNDHLSSHTVEGLPEVRVLQVHPDVAWLVAVRTSLGHVVAQPEI